MLYMIFQYDWEPADINKFWSQGGNGGLHLKSCAKSGDIALMKHFSYHHNHHPSLSSLNIIAVIYFFKQFFLIIHA